MSSIVIDMHSRISLKHTEV